MKPKIILFNSVSAPELARAKEAFPAYDWQTVTKGQEADQLADAEIVFGNVAEELLLNKPCLKWVQSSSAGVDRLAKCAAFLKGTFFLTTAAGMHESCAQHAIALLLGFSRRVGQHAKGQAAKHWKTKENVPVPGVLSGTLGVLGLGEIGKRVCVIARALGLSTVGVNYRGVQVAEADETHAISKLDELLPRFDALIMVVPSTRETDDLLNAARIAKLPPHCIVVNVGRGNAIDETALLAALREKRIAGAALDVFKQEPLPVDSEFYRLPNVIMTPHIGGNRPDYTERAFDIFLENLRRFSVGQPLKNVVERARGY